MKTLIFILSTFISSLLFAQNNYETQMHNAFSEWEKGNDSGILAFQKVEKLFPEEKLPKYYLAFTKTLQSFENGSPLEREKLIDDAKLLIVQLEKSYPNQSEILNLKALNLTSEIVLNPMMNGMALMEDVNSTYSHAMLLDPLNPRTILGKAEFNINAAKFVGGDINSFCKDVEKALVLFETEKVEKFEPSWGKDRAESLLNNECKE